MLRLTGEVLTFKCCSGHPADMAMTIYQAGKKQPLSIHVQTELSALIMYTYIYICMYRYIYIYIYIHVCMYIYMYAYAPVCSVVNIYICIYIYRQWSYKKYCIYLYIIGDGILSAHVRTIYISNANQIQCTTSPTSAWSLKDANMKNTVHDNLTD